jgi:hypothetical protein
MAKAALLACMMILLPSVAAQADGNPHNWDRKRRCDHTDYNPPCGPCEGVGGLATGDDNKDITLTTCEIVANASSIDPKTLIKPVWSTKWHADKYNEILIGPKRDPFCFQIFPGNTSDGNLCYRHDAGTQDYDMSKGAAGPHTLREDLTLYTKVGEVQSKVIHQGQNFWVVNKFPWYAAGIHQCICTQAHEGADPSKPGVYPVQFNWTQQMYFIGREKIGIEYMAPGTTMVLDHWAFGPHHVWSVPATGKTVRMWQPFNGLQVFTNGTDDASGLDPTIFDDQPPAICKKGGATFRIKCTDDGLPQKKISVGEQRTKVANLAKNTNTNTARAIEKVPRAQYKGSTFSNMSNTLNMWLAASAAVKPCDEWSAQELQELSATLYLARDLQLDQVYAKAIDKRRLRMDLSELQKTWSSLNKAVEGHVDRDTLHKIQRDGHCHEAVMWYVHHLSEDVKKVLGETGVEIPLLSYKSHMPHCKATKDHAHGRVCSHYQETVTCASCHSNALPSR